MPPPSPPPLLSAWSPFPALVLLILVFVAAVYTVRKYPRSAFLS